MMSVSIILSSNPSQFHAFSSYLLRLYDEPERARTHCLLVSVLWAPESGEFHNVRFKARPMSQLKPLFEGAKEGKTMQAEVEQAQREGQVLIQYITTNADVKSVNTCMAWTLSAWEKNKSIRLERKLEKKAAAAGPCGGDHLFKSMLDQGYPRVTAQQILDMQALRRSIWYK